MSKILYFLFAPLRFYKLFLIKREMAKRLSNAIDKCKQLRAKAYVCQCGQEFFIGTHKQMDATSGVLKRKLKLNWDWTKFIVYENNPYK